MRKFSYILPIFLTVVLLAATASPVAASVANTESKKLAETANKEMLRYEDMAKDAKTEVAATYFISKATAASAAAAAAMAYDLMTDPPVTAVPTIIKIEDQITQKPLSSAPPAGFVVLVEQGQNFEHTPEDNFVTFAGTVARVSPSSTQSSLTVLVPNLPPGPVNIVVTNSLGSSQPFPFVIEQAPDVQNPRAVIEKYLNDTARLGTEIRDFVIANEEGFVDAGINTDELLANLDTIIDLSGSQEVLDAMSSEELTAIARTIVAGGEVSSVDTSAKPPVTTVSNFNAEVSTSGVMLSWDTAEEVNTAGFNLYRTPAGGGATTKINRSLILSAGSKVVGASYQYIDTPSPAPLCISWRV